MTVSALVYCEFVASRLRDGRTVVSELESDAAEFRRNVHAQAEAYGGRCIEDSVAARPIMDARAFALAAVFPDMKAALQASLELAALYPDDQPPEPGEWRAPGLRLAVDSIDESETGIPWLDPLRLGRALCAVSPAGPVLIGQSAVEGLRGALPDGAGIEPLGNTRLRDLLPRIPVYRLTHASLDADPPELTALDSISNNLPTLGDRFIGRTVERRELRLLLMAHRLISIVGSSGLGKTRLALQTAAEIAPEYAAGVWLVELSELDDPDLIPEAIAGAMGLKPTARSDRLKTVIRAIGDRRGLMLLENCEHLIGRSATIVDRLLSACPNLRIVATSIQALGVSGEYVFELPPLTLPSEDQLEPDHLPETVALFAVRAGERGAPLQTDSETLQHAAELCRLLEGNPLAIELAAARATELEIPELHARVKEKFEALGELDDPTHPRKQSLQAAIEWSIHLLNPLGQLLFRRLSVFRGGATAEAVRAVATGAELPTESIKEAVDELVEKHLLTRQQSDVGERVQMLESLRAHASGLLQQTGTMEARRERHADYYAREVAEIAPLLNGPEQLPALHYLRSEHGNIRAALEYMLETRDLEAGLRLAASLRRFWATSGFFGEGHRVITRLLASEGSDQASDGALAAALFSLGSLETRLSDFGPAETHISEALERATRVKDESVMAKAHNALGRIAFRRGLVEDAREHYESALSQLEELRHPVGIATALNNLALTDIWFGDYSSARDRLERSLEIAHEVGNQRGIAEALNNLAGVVEIQSDFTTSRALIAECLAVLQRLNDRRRTPMAISNLAHVALRRGRIQDAEDLVDEALKRQRELGDSSGVALSSIEHGQIALDLGETEVAERDFEYAQSLSRETGEPRLAISARHGLAEVARRRSELKTAREMLNEALERTRAMPDHLETARILCSLGRLELDCRHAAAARTLLAESLDLRHRIGNRRGMAETLEVMARSIEDTSLAARMLGAAKAGRAALGAPLPPAEVAAFETAVEICRAHLGQEAFDRAFALGEESSLWTITDEVLIFVQQ